MKNSFYNGSQLKQNTNLLLISWNITICHVSGFFFILQTVIEAVAAAEDIDTENSPGR